MLDFLMYSRRIIHERHVEKMLMKTLKGGHMVDIGDWIICGVKGEYYPCKPDIFKLTYERA